MEETEKKDTKISVDQFYEFIVSQMTPEEALKKLLVTQMEYFDVVKDQKKLMEGKEGQLYSPFMVIAQAAWELGWDIALEKGEPDSEIRGMTVGTKEYILSTGQNPPKRDFKVKNGVKTDATGLPADNPFDPDNYEDGDKDKV